MRLLLLHVPDCPNTAVLESRLVSILASRPDIRVTREVITTDDQALRQGMAGSPTLLLDGRDPFARPGAALALVPPAIPATTAAPGQRPQSSNC